MSYNKLSKCMSELSKSFEDARVAMADMGYKPGDKIQELIDGLFSFSKFKVGDRVVLNKTPKIDRENSWGWLGAKHFLVKGAKATIRDVDWHSTEKCFTYGLYFDDESWISMDGSINKNEEKALYCFGEKWLDKICIRASLKAYGDWHYTQCEKK